MDVCPSSLPSQGRWLGDSRDGEVMPERDNLSVCFADSSPERGALDFRSPQEGKIHQIFYCTFY